MRMVQANSCTRRTMPARAGNYEPQNIRDNIFPCDLHPAERLRVAFPEKQGAQMALAKSTGFSVIITAVQCPPISRNSRIRLYTP
jgi:hypothetical protein